MIKPSLIRALATGSVAAGAAVLCWFNRLPHQEQEQAEQAALDCGRRLLEKARQMFDGDDPHGPTPLPV